MLIVCKQRRGWEQGVRSRVRRCRRGTWPGRAVIAVAFLLAGSAIWGCAPAVKEAQAGGPSATAELLVRRGTFARSLLLTGEISAVEAADIMVPRTPTWQVAIRWMEADGADVKAGQKVLELDNSQFVASLEASRLTASRNRKELERQQAQNEVLLAEKSFEAESRRIAFEKAAIDADVAAELLSDRELQDRRLARDRTRVEFDKAKEELAAARRGCEADLAVARIALTKAESELNVAEQAISALTVTAPRAGVLEIREHPWQGRKFQIGDSAWAGLVVMRIPDLSRVQVEAQVFDVDDGVVRPDAEAICTLDTYPDLRIKGRVTNVTAIANETARNAQRRVFRATIALEQPPTDKLLPGMSVRAEVAAGTQRDVLIAPRAALEIDAGGARVWLAKGEPAPVELGECSALECVVRSGVTDGARLRPVVHSGDSS
jgi:multidrug resistance efflux pump